MLKTILILALIIFVLSRVGGFIFRALFWLLGTTVIRQAQREYQRGEAQRGNGRREEAYARRRPEGSINIDYVPEKENSGRRAAGYSDGEYVDYEEVK